MKLEWGKKVVCPGCATKFYDLKRSPAVCPKCRKSFLIGDNKQVKKSVLEQVFQVEEEKIDFSDIEFEIDDDDGAIPDASVVVDTDNDE